jgi:membrane-associated phospholipid phosphatase
MDGMPAHPGRPLLAPSARLRAVVLLACCAIIVAVLAALFAHQARPDWLDRAVDAPVISWFDSRQGLGRWLIFPGSLLPASALTAAIVVSCLIIGRLNGAVLAVAALPAADGLNDGLLKPLVHRTYLGVLTYPSGHTTAVFAIAATITVLLLSPTRKAGAGALRILVPVTVCALAAVVATGLIGLRFHYFTDTVAGAALGIGTVFGLALVLDLPAFQRWLAQHSRQPSAGRERRCAAESADTSTST